MCADEVISRTTLRFAPPFASAPLQAFLAAHALPGREQIEGPGVTRVVEAAGGPAVARFELPAADQDQLSVRLALTRAEDQAEVVAVLRRWLDLDLDPEAVDTSLARHPRLAPLVAQRPGLRVPGSVHPTETAMGTVLGQQVSLAAARTFSTRLVQHWGRPGPAGFTLYPEPDRLAAADPETLRASLGITGARARTLQSLAGALAGGLDLGPDADRRQTRADLLALPGVGPWTADYIALRCLGDRDAFLPGDLVLRRALKVQTPAEASRLAEHWSPWRSYALLHLWTSAVFA